MLYQQFSDEWRKEISKLPKAVLLGMVESPIEPTLQKKQIIEKLRVQLIVKSFNDKYPIGSKVNWRPVADDEGVTPYLSLTTRSAAIVSNSGQAVVFFKERSGYCSIEPIFIM